MASVLFFSQLVLVLAVARLADIALSRTNSAWALARGAREYDRARYPLLPALWAGLYAGTLIEVWWFDAGFHPALAAVLIAVALASEGIRWWAIASLGTSWTQRIVVQPNHALIAGGPYRFLRHPADLAGAVFGLALPLAHSAWVTALCFTVGYGVLMWQRVRLEELILGVRQEAHPVASEIKSA